MAETGEGRSWYGVVYGIAAYGLWGLIPLYFKAVAQVAPVEVLAHRALWSFVMLVVLVHVLGRWRELWRGLHNGRLSTMGILQYLAPSLQFLLAVLAFGEPFSSVQLLSFACIWTAVLIYTLDALRAAREYRIEVVEPD